MSGHQTRRSIVNDNINLDFEDVLNPNRLELLFAEFDLDNSGAITIDEFENIMNRVNAGMTRQEIADLTRQVDKDGNSEIDYDEFVQLMNLANNKLVSQLNSVKSHYLDEKALAAGAADVV
eukprot:913567-Prymnesium_polylepis.1